MPRGFALTTVRASMTAKVFAIGPGARVKEARALTDEHRVSHLPVVSEGKAVGVVCTCDLEEAATDADVSSIMHAPPVGIEPNRTLAEAAELMADRGVGSLLVTDAGALVGILTRTDLERAGLAEAAFGERRCSACGSFHHVKADAGGYLTCGDCRRARGQRESVP